MKKVVKKIALLLIVFGIGVGVTLYTNNKYKVYDEEEPKQIMKHVDTISMMIETEAKSGNYEMTTRSEWAAKIAETTWKVGGNTFANIGTQPAKTAYQNEIVSPVTTNTTDGATEHSAKIGLMYVSDYMYAASQDKWTLVGNGSATTDYRAATSVNWMYMGFGDWTISRSADNSSSVFGMYSTGYVDYGYVGGNSGCRPSFSLLSSTTYVSGSGSASDPMVIN